MLFFENDYGYGAHPKVLEYLAQTNMEPVSGYGNDKFTASAAEKIKAAADCPDAQVYFLTGGTQTNMVVIDTLLRPYEGVVASSCGHVNTHEAGAIESTGHKVLTVPHKNGKLDADDLREYVQTFYADASHDHMVFPGMVYISHPSEYGTLYTRNELERISAVCREFDMPLFLDGARLGYGLTADTDVTLQDIAKLTDVFYIGGTKCGALCGEAVVFTHGNMPKQFVNGQAPRRNDRQGPSERAAVRRPVYRRSVRENLCTGGQTRHQVAGRSQSKGIPLCTGIPDKPAVHHCRKQQTARAAKQGSLQLYREI